MKRWMEEDINTPKYFDHKWTHNKYSFDVLRCSSAMVKFKVGGSVVDLGAGVCGVCSWIASKGVTMNTYSPSRLVAVDYSKEAIRIVTTENPIVEGVVCDLRYTPFESSSFDYVVSTEVIEHMEDPNELIVEMQRLVKPSGTIAISTVDPSGPVRRAGCVFPEHLWVFEPEDLKQMFRKYFSSVVYDKIGDYHYIWAGDKK